MEANELRIGNYVYPFNEDILIIGTDVIAKQIIKVCSDDFKDTSKLKPIPLTEEWLVKFGFYKGESKEHGYLWLKCKMGEMYVRPSYLGGFYWGFDYNNELDNQNNIKHVHQLQNLYFALTNEELTIK